MGSVFTVVNHLSNVGLVCDITTNICGIDVLNYCMEVYTLTELSLSFSSDLEWEESEWTVNARNYYSHSDSTSYLEPLDVPRDASLTLYAHMQHTWY